MISAIGQIAIVVKDTKRATAFYRDTLGLRLLFEAGEMAFFDCGGVRLMLSPPSGPEHDPPGSVIYYRVDDLAATHATLAAKGVVFHTPPHRVARLPDHELWMAFLHDTEGNLLALMSEVRPGG
jgi:methylmalonyl-CoA/ethylmalonyl-CoA epimerase